MIPALNDLRRAVGLPTVPTLARKRRASRVRRKQWLQARRDAFFWWRVGGYSRGIADKTRNLAACPDNLLGETDAEQRGRMVRMEQAVILGWVQGMTHNTKREEE